MFGHSVNVTFYTMLVDVEVAPMVLNTYPPHCFDTLLLL